MNNKKRLQIVNKEMIVDQLLEFIVDTYMVEREDIPLDKSLIDEGIIDSIGLFEIASFLKNSFSISIYDEDIIEDNFGSIIKIAGFVERQIAQD